MADFALLPFILCGVAVRRAKLSFYPSTIGWTPTVFLRWEGYRRRKSLSQGHLRTEKAYLYFLHALCTLVFPDSFLGVWFMEAALCFVMLFFVYKILKLSRHRRF
ncbi:MAG: hypothetical protein ACLRSW_06490 [Christensenellaceae bacterium]